MKTWRFRQKKRRSLGQATTHQESGANPAIDSGTRTWPAGESTWQKRYLQAKNQPDLKKRHLEVQQRWNIKHHCIGFQVALTWVIIFWDILGGHSMKQKLWQKTKYLNNTSYDLISVLTEFRWTNLIWGTMMVNWVCLNIRDCTCSEWQTVILGK